MEFSRDLSQAREAYKNNDIEASKKAHSNGAKEQHQQEQGKYLKSIVYGGLDGIITTFAVVAGVKGAELAGVIVLIMGLANLLGDGLSMGMGDYLSTKSEQEYQSDERSREAWEVEHYPEGEKLELIELYQERGYSPEDSQTLVNIIAKNEKAWVDIMMVEELGILEDHEPPLNNAIATFLSFLVFGSIPLLAYILAIIFPNSALDQNVLFIITLIATGITMFALGALKSKFTGKNLFISGLETLIVGTVAAGAAFLIGFALNGLVP